MITVETDLGTITVNKAAIGKIIIEAARKFDGKVIISNHKGKVPGWVPKLGGMDEINHMEIELNENGLDIRVFVVLRFGTSITQVTNQMVDEIHNNIKNMTGMEPNSVAVVVTGVLSKHVAPRHIEVTR
ncbi:Asp23/Gls24 family envelope stress response protein [bacterium 210820-DFI.6.37]|nr:Asp23/Gls24 family envelope stress response protein [bacterium 210820-DFI.6.37]